MAWRIERAETAIRDLDAVFDYLVEASLSFGEDLARAVDRATDRVVEIENDMFALKHAPFQGATDPVSGLRHVTKGRAVLYFDLHQEAELIRIVAVFFGGQDHVAHMARRMTTGNPN